MAPELHWRGQQQPVASDLGQETTCWRKGKRISDRKGRLTMRLFTHGVHMLLHRYVRHNKPKNMKKQIIMPTVFIMSNILYL